MYAFTPSVSSNSTPSSNQWPYHQRLLFNLKFMDRKSFYLANDIDFALDSFRTYISFVEKSWKVTNIPGRPTVVFLITNEIYEAHVALNSALISILKKLYSGYINGARVELGNLETFLTTSCITNLTFLETRINPNGRLSVFKRVSVFQFEILAYEQDSTSKSKNSHRLVSELSA